jgi:hypothetical protein
MVQVPCLEDYLDLHKFTLFISFLKAKGCTSNTIKGHFHQSKRDGAMVHGQTQQLSWQAQGQPTL